VFGALNSLRLGLLNNDTGQIQDADAASAALQLTQDNTQLQAAFEMQAGLPTKSLLSYLG
jgi:flagellin-like hook-associated protein FlgL